MRLLILGCGDIGTRVGEALSQNGWHITAARRNVAKLPAIFERHSVDLTDPASFEALTLVRPDYVLVTPTPQGYDPAGYQSGFLAVAETLAQQHWLTGVRRVIWISSTRVYRQSQGGWVDEYSPLNTQEPQSAAIVAAEAAVRRGAMTTVIRPSGIYGDPDGMLMRRVLSGVAAAPAASYGNRIHREDLARLITHCLLRDANAEAVPPTLIASDSDHTPTHEIERWLAVQMGVSLREETSNARNRANRRCRNDRLAQLGFEFRFPTWRDGYTAMLSAREALSPH